MKEAVTWRKNHATAVQLSVASVRYVPASVVQNVHGVNVPLTHDEAAVQNRLVKDHTPHDLPTVSLEGDPLVTGHWQSPLLESTEPCLGPGSNDGAADSDALSEARERIPEGILPQRGI